MTQSSGQEKPQTISLLALADRFRETQNTMSNRAFAFVLGAGASRSSGIKGAAQMVDDWVPLLHREVVGDADDDCNAWATAQTLGITNYNSADRAASYSELYHRMYAQDPDRGYAYLEAQMRTAEPSYGYSVLARIMETTRHKVVVTTNFDNLVADSLSIFSQTYPLVCGHESLAGFISARVRRPLVVKVHRDLLLAPKSSPKDLGNLPDAFSKALAEIFRHYTPIVIGYGGNDGSLMKFLKDLPEQTVPGGVYWCYWDEGDPPSDEIQRFVAAQQGALVPIPGFDEAMMLLGEALEFDVPDKFVLDRAEARAKRIVEQVHALKARLNRTQRAPVMAEAGLGASEALTRAVEKTMQRTSGALRWWQWDQRANATIDIDERDRIYREAIAALPDSVELITNYAVFLTGIRKDHDQAEAYYAKALDADPTNAAILSSYAIFLSTVHRDYDLAETYYRKALTADPMHANVLNNYALFLMDFRKEHDQAEVYYTKALAAGPTHANILSNYALFLETVRKDHSQAEIYYKKALAIDPTHANILGNYTSFLLSLGRTGEGLAMLERGIATLGQLAPNDTQFVETWMYATCHWLPEGWHKALGNLKPLLLTDKITTGDWDFSGVIEAAKRRDHPAAEWLYPLAAMCAGTVDASTLSGWDAWNNV